MLPLSLSYDHRVIDGARRRASRAPGDRLSDMRRVLLMHGGQGPDIGDFNDVPVIEMLVAAGDEVAAEDRWSCSSPTRRRWRSRRPRAGKVTEIKVAVGDKVARARVLLDARSAAESGQPAPSAPAEEARAEARRGSSVRDADVDVATMRSRAGSRPGRLHGGLPRRRPRH